MLSLLCRAVESPYSKAVDEDFERYADEIQRANDSKGVSGLLQAVLGQTAKLPEPRLDNRKEALYLVNVDSF